MIILIAAITIILYIILISFSLHNLSLVESNKVKVAYIIIGLLMMLICTFITYIISSRGVEYSDIELIKKIRNMLLLVFIPVNGLIIMPYLANLLSKIGLNQITQEKFKKRIIILGVIFIIILIFESSYFRSTQLGIINMIINKK